MSPVQGWNGTTITNQMLTPIRPSHARGTASRSDLRTQPKPIRPRHSARMRMNFRRTSERGEIVECTGRVVRGVRAAATLDPLQRGRAIDPPDDLAAL
mmetsp:Transcript_18034/g.40402  ORF Transcript_18034/g.40402 Transcript_18034/m.40402 type:complete len:98 (-) Transcript_18034:1238-1531(-)